MQSRGKQLSAAKVCFEEGSHLYESWQGILSDEVEQCLGADLLRLEAHAPHLGEVRSVGMR